MALLIVWMAAATAVGVVAVVIYEVKRTPPVRRAAAAPVDELPPRQPFDRGTRWTVTEHLSAHRVLIAQVETAALGDAVSIAQQLTEPLKDKYVEVLIYFHRPGRPDTLPPRRVQWTRKDGYVETRYGEPGR